jgi:DNA primase
MPNDVERLRSSHSVSAVAAQFGVKLKRDGGELIACCPLHAENTASFTIFNGRDGVERFHCFGCNERGDVLDFVQKIKGVNLPEAIRILDGNKATPNVERRAVEPRDVYAGIKPIWPTTEIKQSEAVKLYNPKRADTEWAWGKFTPSMIFPYPMPRTSNSRLIRGGSFS